MQFETQPANTNLCHGSRPGWGAEKSAGLGGDEQRPLQPSEVYFFLNYRPSGPVSKMFKVLEESWNSALPHASSVSPEVPPHMNYGLKYILFEECWNLRSVVCREGLF